MLPNWGKPLPLLAMCYTFAMNVDDYMELIGDMPVSDALSQGFVRKCVHCGLLHPGVESPGDRLGQFCNTSCALAYEAAHTSGTIKQPS